MKINIDSFEFAKDNLGNQYRAALVDITEVNTFPQCFIGGEFLGGAVDGGHFHVGRRALVHMA